MKGLIIAAGYGTRFLPVTKTIPKEMLPLITRPAIDFIIDEFVKSGIKEILIITSRRKKALDDYFDRETELESLFTSENNDKKLSAIKPPNAQIFFIRQQEMMGTGHAIMQAKSFMGTDPFVVAYPDDLHFGDKPLSKQLIDTFNGEGGKCSVMSSLHAPANLERYGVFALDNDGKHITDIVEKPAPGKEPSCEASIGRFLFTADIFSHLQTGWEAHLAKGIKGEYFHIYALKKLMDERKVLCKPIEGLRLDTGEPIGYLRAIIHYAKQEPELLAVLKEELLLL